MGLFQRVSQADATSKPGMQQVDSAVANLTQTLAQHTMSRRRFWTSVAKFALAITGATVVPILPLDREVQVAEAQGDCNSNWRYCGLYTARLCSCAGCGQFGCPSGTTQGNNPWMTCCNAGGSWYRIAYYDCCRNTSGGGAACCNATGCECHKGSYQPNWCGGAPTNQLCCTYAYSLGPC